MTNSISHAPELLVQTWFNSDRPILLSALRGRVVVLSAFQVLCPNSIALDYPNDSGPIPHTMERYKMRGTPSLVLIDRHGIVRKHAFGAVDDLRIGAEIGALVQQGGAAAMPRSSAA